MKTFNCNTSSAWVAGVLRANKIPVQIKTRILAESNGKWDFHADIAFYDEEGKKWVGVSPAGLLAVRNLLNSKGTAMQSGGLGLDIDPGYKSVMVDAANNVGRNYVIEGWSPIGTDYNTEAPMALGKTSVSFAPKKITHSITPLRLDN